MADDVVPVAHPRRVRDVRLLLAGPRAAPHGQSETLRAEERPYHLQSSTNPVQRLDIL